MAELTPTGPPLPPQYVMTRAARADGAESDLPFRRKWLRRFYDEVLHGKRNEWTKGSKGGPPLRADL